MSLAYSDTAPAVAPRRPALRYHGGKWRLASWIISHLPPHSAYVEPFGGGASVLLRKARAFSETYNDLDGEVVNLFAVLRDWRLAARLQAQCELTPFARAEFDLAYQESDDAVERARRLLVRSFMGHGSCGARAHRTGFRATQFRSHTLPQHDWAGWPNTVPALCERLRGVVIENRPAADVIDRYDDAATLFYLDPPYPFSTRSQKRKGNDLLHGYRHELTDAQHGALLAQLKTLRGMVVLSGYPSPLYDAALDGWRSVSKAARSDRAGARVEVLWLNPATVAGLQGRELEPA